MKEILLVGYILILLQAFGCLYFVYRLVSLFDRIDTLKESVNKVKFPGEE